MTAQAQRFSTQTEDVAEASPEPAANLEPTSDAEPAASSDPEPDSARRPPFPWILGIAGALSFLWLGVVLAGIGLFAAVDAWRDFSLAGWASIIAAITAPLCLVWLVALALLLHRKPPGATIGWTIEETQRLAYVAAQMSEEISRFDGAVAIVAERVHAGRAAIGADLAGLIGHAADVDSRTQRIVAEVEAASMKAQRLAADLTQAGADALRSVESVTSAVQPAQRDVEVLDARLQALDASLARAGATAQEQVDGLHTTLERLAREQTATQTAIEQLGQALTPLGQQAADLCGRLRAEAASLATAADQQGSRLEATGENVRTALEGLLTDMSNTLEATQRAIHAQSAALHANAQSWADHARSATREALKILNNGISANRLASGQTIEILHRDVAAVTQATGDAQNRLSALKDALSSAVAAGVQELERLSAQTRAAFEGSAALDAPLSALDGRAEALGARMHRLLADVGTLTQSLDQTLTQKSEAFDHVQTKRIALAKALAEQMTALETQAQSTNAALGDTTAGLTHLSAALARETDRLADTHCDVGEKIQLLAQEITQLREDAAATGLKVSSDLLEALNRIRAAALQARSAIDDTAGDIASAVSNRLTGLNLAAIRASILAPIEDALAALEDAGRSAAAGAGARAAELEGSLARIEAAARAAQRAVTEAETRQERISSADYSRMSAALIERLNSSAIDVAKAMAVDLPDTYWQEYLKGDRSVFARRARQLLDRSERTHINKLYRDDAEFREQVHRFVQDFERLIGRSMQEREGQAIAVTLLSSDLGKLYVALAQSIKRLSS